VSAVPTSFFEICGVIDEWRQCGKFGAAFDKVLEVGLGPKAPAKRVASKQP